ncbi:MAG: response regulator [Rhodocyclaceae bacterium]|nr:response regulator [Rhodocyclaceae bacterium]
MQVPNKKAKKYRLLGIDPSSSLRAVLGQLGDECGSVVALGADLAQARQRLAEADYDLVVTAAELPDGNYADVLAAVRAHPGMAHTPVILLAATRSHQIVQEALQKGMTEVFFKRDLADLMRYLERFSVIVPACKGSAGGLRALVVEDDRALGYYYKELLIQQGFAVDYVPSGEAALWEAERHCYDFILVDLVLGGSCSGMQFLRRLRDPALASSQTVAIAISAYEDEARRLEALRAGANGFISKPIKEAELAAVIQGMVHRPSGQGETPSPPSAATAPCKRCQPCQLTPRESNICALVDAGYSDKRIAEEMGVSYWTVRTHIAHAFKKCQVSNRVELVRRLRGG